MEQFLAFVLALLAFAIFAFIAGRAAKFLIVLGCALIAYFILVSVGIIG